MAYWVLQNNLYSEEGFTSLVTALERFGLPYSEHRCVPFAGTLEPDAHPPAGPVIVMGSYTLAHHAKARGWKPGAWLDNLDFRIHLAAWGERMLNADAQVCRLADVRAPAPWFFIRPVLDTKSFTGQVMSADELDAWQARVATLDADATLNADTEVMVSTQKELYSETRTWIVQGEVVTASGYKVGSLRRQLPPDQVDSRITDFARACAALWSPNDAFVLDVADTPDGLRIIEVNNLNSAGFYKADMQKLVFALNELAG